MTELKRILGISVVIFTIFSAKAQDSIMSSTGDLFSGFTRKITYDKMIPPYGIEVSFRKTVHIIFPSAIRYVDLGSMDIIAGKADGSENVLRVKSAVQSFKGETNFSVITDEGSFYAFNVKYADEPDKLNIEMKDFIHNSEQNRPNNTLDIYLNDVQNESPRLIKLIMKSIYQSNRDEIKHIFSKSFGVTYSLKGIYICNGMFYFHTQMKNASNVPFDIDFIRLKVVDKRQAKRTAIQETLIKPIRAYRYALQIQGKQTVRTVFVTEKFTIPDSKKLVVELYEKNGGRHQTFTVENSDLVKAKPINELKVK
ncbi:MAG: conjugative transposon protein TraN [Prevotellaceae bacterium]|jgi:conjugative transposon TraN protein|nr:conjugative transposon protein TraN [Prevotellaceae bacterium]